MKKQTIIFGKDLEEVYQAEKKEERRKKEAERLRIFEHIDSIVRGLNPEEKKEPKSFLKKLNTTDLSHVIRVIKSVDEVANEYLGTGEHFQNDTVFYRDLDDKTIKQGKPFFTVYAIGGCLTKEGERPDIDLLVATNMRWSQGFLNGVVIKDRLEQWDPMLVAINKEFPGFKIKLIGELPDNYNLGETRGKCIIEITPEFEGRKIDVCYVRSMKHHNTTKESEYLEHFFIDEEEFIERDVDEKGNPLARKPLYRRNGSLDRSKGY